MKRFLLILSLLALPAFSADPAKAVEEAERGWAKGLTTNDFALLNKVLGDDLSYTHSNGAFDTKASYIDNLKTGKARYFKVDHEDIKVRMLSQDTAITTCHASVLTLVNGKQTPARLTFLHVFVKRNGQWQMVAHQSAKLP